MTERSKEIVPWICHICGGKFNTLNGGICERCKGVTCRSHLNLFGKNYHMESKVICDKCLTEEEQKIAKEKKIKISAKLPKILKEKE